MTKKTRVRSYKRKDGTVVKSHLREKPNKKKLSIRTSYYIITEESAKEGDYAETGWIDKKGEEFDDIDEVVEV